MEAQNEALYREYQEIGNNMRHYGIVRTTRLAMLFTLNGALLAANENMIPPRIRSIAGLLVVAMFWLADVHIRRAWGTYRDRGIAIEKHLGLGQYSQVKANVSVMKKGWTRIFSTQFYVSSTFSTRATFALFVAIWITKLANLW
jgi:hypothetical protein